METIEWIVICAVFALVFVFPKEGSSLSKEQTIDPGLGVSVGKCPGCGDLYTLGGGFGAHMQGCSNKKVSDRLGQMWDQQVEFMKLLQERRGFPDFPTDLTSKKGQQFLKDIRNHLMEELFEAGQHLKNAKSHRATDVPDVDREAYKEELVDALHLYFELVIASGISPEELFEAYLKKGEINFDRIRGTY